MPEGLKIQVGADVQQAVKALGTDVPRAADKAGASFSKLSAVVNNTSSVFAQTNPNLKAGAANFKILGEAGQLAGSKLRSLSGVLNTTASSIPVLTQNTKVAGGSFLKLISTFGLAYGAGSILAAGISTLASELIGVFTGANKLASATKMLAEAQREAAESSTKEVVQLEVLYAVAKDVSLSYGQRQSAIDKINKSYPELHRNLTLENIGNKGVAESIQLVTESLINRARVSSLVKVISDLRNRIAELGPIREAALGGIARKEIDQLTGRVKLLTDEAVRLQGVVSTIGSSGTIFGGLSVSPLGDILGGEGEKIKKIKKVKDFTNEIISEAKKISDAFKGGIDLKLNLSVLDTQKEELKKSLSFLKDFKAGNFKFTTALAIKIKIEDVEFPPIPEVIQDTRTDAQRFSDILGKQYTDYFKDNPVDISLVLAVQNANLPLTDAGKLGQSTGAAFTAGLQEALTNGFAAIGEGLGNALAGNGSIGDAFKGFALAVGEALQVMGKNIIGIGVAALLAKVALETLFANPVLAILAGTALVAAGAAMKSALSGGVKGFAQGGLVSGPQLALIGEGSGTSRSNPEVVAPLDQLRSMIGDLGGGRQTVYVTGRLRGNDIMLQNSRTSRSQRRAGVR